MSEERKPISLEELREMGAFSDTPVDHSQLNNHPLLTSFQKLVEQQQTFQKLVEQQHAALDRLLDSPTADEIAECRKQNEDVRDVVLRAKAELARLKDRLGLDVQQGQ